MSTRSMIGIRYADGTVKANYCHNDGSIEHNGKILLESYNTKEKVEALLALGDLSFLGSKIEPDQQKPHTFDDPQDDVVIAYHRDRGEYLNPPASFENVYEFRDVAPDKWDAVFLYVFSVANGVWSVYDVFGDKKEWETLSSRFWVVKGEAK